MEPKTSGDRRVAGMNKWMAGLTVGIWAIVFIMLSPRWEVVDRYPGAVDHNGRSLLEALRSLNLL